ncbi:HK97 family phage prohead protease [Mesorhizobium sp. M4A.F.Ca.ET.050.02.1.1]|uniref:HK97 family phage prohead protease n=1 Tax=Mesorhizobium sp. M4A.F.Ca.ET.050.02.1.1 TaxID=2496754 RepID=UPI000FCB5E3B|nr:HK97 family phage prohead protease [Mesorhizobium sp. M4A.F.Ca.ET.050.02.1.1]RUX51438.1 HK97 family phage prohead protease [Mesorhizobium sp. M4A.F.Ca.ET.050.02.1.1]TIT91020.1 MAG: HK97 family phage prohead protease [Mesorhizobium sp.]
MAEPFISGYAIQWQQPANIGGLFIERFARGAFDKSIRESGDSVVACWAHDMSRPLGRVSNGSLEIKADAVGLWYALTPNPESPMGQEALASVGSGLVDEVSVCFFSESEEWDDTGDLPQRLVTQAGLVELSLVIFGAYGKATSAALTRSETSMGNAASARRRLIEKMERDQRLRGIN